MNEYPNYKKEFLAKREKLFTNEVLFKDSFEFCVKHSLLVDDYIQKLLGHKNFSCAVAAVGGFSRRELSPYSDIDIMFISDNSNLNEKEIQTSVTALWDSGIEVSHTIREFSDIDKFLKNDLHAFTQFFETRLLVGDKETYIKWNERLISGIEKSDKAELISQYINDNKLRYKKYGSSPKVLEPNIKFSGGGLRDIHSIEWNYLIRNSKLIPDRNTLTQTQMFFNELFDLGQINSTTAQQLHDSYKIVLRARNMLHLIERRKNDKLEFAQQEAIALKLGYTVYNWKEFMHEYFRASTILNRFSKTMMKKIQHEYSPEIINPSITELDNDFELIIDTIKFKNDRKLQTSDIMQAFYYRCRNNASFDQNLRLEILQSIHLIKEGISFQGTSSKYFREMLKLPSNVGKTLLAMNEYGFLNIIIPEFKKLNGFFQPGVYHCYTADEHTLLAIQNLENLSADDNQLAKVFNSLSSRDTIYLAILLHDIAKPISVTGHEIIGAEISKSIMYNLGYSKSEIMQVQFLVKYHLEMTQIAFRRDVNNPLTLNNFISIFPSIKELDLLYLLSYADLTAVNPRVWTQWKSDLLYELYDNSKSMLLDQISGEELINFKMNHFLNNNELNNGELFNEHLDQVDDLSYLFHFSQDEIVQHIDEIKNGNEVSVLFKEDDSFTNITVIAKDTISLLSKLCGSFVINDLNIHDAKIFTRKDSIIIDSFNVTDFRTHKSIGESRYEKIKSSIINALSGNLNIVKEIQIAKSRWKRLTNNMGDSTMPLDVEFEEHDNYNIIDISAPDKIGLLYNITNKMSELGLTVAFAKISTKVDGVLDAFYVNRNNGKKIKPSEYQFIRNELIQEINNIL
jgi:[protein-PII] uridylyltransferase